MARALEILMRRKKMFLIPFLVVFVVPAVFMLLFMRTYVADAVIWLDPGVTLASVMDQSGGGSGAQPIQQASDTIRQLLATRSFVLSVIEKTPLKSKVGSPRDSEHTVAYVQRNMAVDVVGPNSLRISFAAGSPEEALVVVSAATDRFVSWTRSEVKKQNDESVGFFEEQTTRYQTELAAKSVELREFREAHPEVRQLEIKDKVLTLPDITVTPQVESDYQRLAAEQSYAQDLYERSLDDLAKNRAQASAREERYVNGLRIADKAAKPAGFSTKRLLLADFLALLVAIVVGALAVWLAELNDGTFHHARDVEEALELPVLVEVGQADRAAKRV